MKNSVLLLVLVFVVGCSSHKSNWQDNKTSSFSSDNGDGTYTNPILRADYPDPDIIRVGEDYYMVSSSFVAMPGIPILHSKDLINWKNIGHAYDSITFQPQYRMEDGKTAYSRICWAPTFKYHEGIFYIGVNIKDDGFVMFKSTKPEGPYTMHKFSKPLYDPGLFIDEDGKKYVTHGMNKILITRIKDDGTDVLNPDDNGTLIITAPENYSRYFEGCHTYKRNGWYYVFNPAMGYDGVQMVSRSRNLLGPYETKLLIKDDINYAGAGVHQGGYIETLEGESWAYTFQDKDYLGRCPMLYPMKWVNDWPVVGPDGKSEKGVVTYKKPAVKAKTELQYPQESDDFDSKELKQVWEFNHVPQRDKWSLTDHSGHFRIYSQYASGFYTARNSLTQKVSALSSSTVLLDVNGLKEGDFAGSGIMGSQMYQLGVFKKESSFYLEIHEGGKNIEDENVLNSLKIDGQKIYLKTEITKKGSILFYYSFDDKKYNRFGDELVSNFWGFLGIRHTLFCYNVMKGNSNGYADFDFFRLEGTQRGNHYNAFSEVDFSQYDDRSGMQLIRPIAKRPMQYVSEIKEDDWMVFNNLTFKKQPSKFKIEIQNAKQGAVVEIRKGVLSGKLIIKCELQNQEKDQWEVQSFDINSKEIKEKEKLFFVFKGQCQGLSVKSFFFE
ncbi:MULTISPECIES: family 43 glycosylhydrolase [Flavobacterium]|uniref:family 43 glycosylhydrolase n=1 Tax=Flavobacterium TaxID=237 RepID=UPI0011833310|nr:MULTISPECIES: family 43 glycosylhydrolase [Flavobacterium]MCR4033692.1 family 43 glycosylhydrolase [Flavobacterium panacis]